MPKSYLSDEPACQRAERNYFDPYLQVVSRLQALTHMGHITDKIELIVLGGTWSDYPAGYQIWFVSELFRALNDGDRVEQNAAERRGFYRGKGLSYRKEDLLERVGEKQQEVNSGVLGYNRAIEQLYYHNSILRDIASQQVLGFDDLDKQHIINETAEHRVVGLAIETRPDTVTCENLKLLRRLGCTKVQIGIQSLNPEVLRLNNRRISLDKIREAFGLLRIFGFKIHAHFMVNLYGSSPEEDKQDYRHFVTEAPYLPDEVKLYPCALVEGTRLCQHYADGTWLPYSEDELLDILVADTLNTPPFIRISRMIRDISAHDILAGNKKANLRQLVEHKIEGTDESIAEMRYREISTSETDVEGLELVTIAYETSVTDEYFLQWVTPENRIAGFLRLSLPKREYVRECQAELPVEPDEAMIREVHIYGKVAKMHGTGEGAQHLGLGRQLIETACDIAKARGYQKLNVISSVGTRDYYRSLGFSDNDLYQQMDLA
jgi:elongator complex protein 3